MQIPGECVDNSWVDQNGIFQQSWREKNDPSLFCIFSTFSFQGKIIYQSNCNLWALLCIFLCYFIKQTLVMCCSFKICVWVNYKVEIGKAKSTKWDVICCTEDCCTHISNLWFLAGGYLSQRKSLWKFELLSVITGWLELIQLFSPYSC